MGYGVTFSAEPSSCEVPLPTSLGPMQHEGLGGVAVGADLSAVGDAVVAGPSAAGAAVLNSSAKLGSIASADSTMSSSFCA